MEQMFSFSPLADFVLNDHEYKLLASFIQENYGIFLKDEKRSLLTSRLQGMLTEMNCKSYGEFHQRLIADPTGEIAVEMVNRITTNHTFFMRESDHFTFFQQKVLPALKKSITDHDLRIWCAACSTGEESYTLAMLVDEFLRDEKHLWDSRILATDISARALERAVTAVYSAEAVDRLPISWRLKYLEKTGPDQYKINDDIRREVIYRKFNLMDQSFPFRKKFHAIFCRNVMIYFDEETKYVLADKLYECTEPGGYLFIGHSETLLRDRTRFRYIMPAVYRRD